MTTNDPPVKIDAKIFEELFRQYFYPLTGFANHILYDPEASRDVVHTVFVNLWENREHMHLNTSLKSWLFTSVKNRCLNYLRDNRKFIHGDPSENQMTDKMAEAEKDLMAVAETEGRIKMAIDKLPDACRKIFLMNRFEGFKYREVAEKLGISEKTVETQMSRALKILRNELKDLILILLILLKIFWGM